MTDKKKNNIDLPRIENAIKEILLAVGEDPKREGLKDTPYRVATMYTELLGGMSEDPKKHIKNKTHIKQLACFNACALNALGPHLALLCNTFMELDTVIALPSEALQQYSKMSPTYPSDIALNSLKHAETYPSKFHEQLTEYNRLFIE